MKVVNWTYKFEYKNSKKEIDQAIKSVINSGKLILGPKVESFENNFATHHKQMYGIGVGNGTDALIIALKALNITKGDEVITSANCPIPTVSAIIAVGAKPVFVDIDEETFSIQLQDIPKYITKDTKCIIAVHMYGLPLDLEKLQEISTNFKIPVLEDCAQATGASWNNKMVGSKSMISAYSFYPTKVIGAFGDGGMITTNNYDLATSARALRMYGTNGNYYSNMQGFNSRLDELQAAILNVKLLYISKYIKERQYISNVYKSELSHSGINFQFVHKLANHVYHLLVVRHAKRNLIIEKLNKKQIDIKIHYPTPVYLMKGYSFLNIKKGTHPKTEVASNEVFSLPIFIGMTDDQIMYVIQSLKNIIKRI